MSISETRLGLLKILLILIAFVYFGNHDSFINSMIEDVDVIEDPFHLLLPPTISSKLVHSQELCFFPPPPPPDTIGITSNDLEEEEEDQNENAVTSDADLPVVEPAQRRMPIQLIDLDEFDNIRATLPLLFVSIEGQDIDHIQVEEMTSPFINRSELSIVVGHTTNEPSKLRKSIKDTIYNRKNNNLTEKNMVSNVSILSDSNKIAARLKSHEEEMNISSLPPTPPKHVEYTVVTNNFTDETLKSLQLSVNNCFQKFLQGSPMNIPRLSIDETDSKKTAKNLLGKIFSLLFRNS